MRHRIKKSIATKDVADFEINPNIIDTYIPQAGDVGVFEVIELGRHETIQSDSKRNIAIFPGDIFMACFANRYATSQFEGYVPDKPMEIVHILGAGGAIGIVKSKNQSLKDIEPTKIRLIGYCCDGTGTIINTKFLNKKRVPFNGHLPFPTRIVLSIGSTMDSGKTTTAAFTVRGLKASGKKVAFIKFTGTSYTKDKDFVYDCGADLATDFSDMGFPSTYMCEKQELLDLYQTLLESLKAEAPDYIVMEIADGLLQRETNFLLRDKGFMSTIHSVIFSCGDSLSAFQGVKLLNDFNIQLSAISGRFTMSPLLIEEVKNGLEIPVLTIDQLMTGAYNDIFIRQQSAVA